MMILDSGAAAWLYSCWLLYLQSLGIDPIATTTPGAAVSSVLCVQGADLTPKVIDHLNRGRAMGRAPSMEAIMVW